MLVVIRGALLLPRGSVVAPRCTLCANAFDPRHVDGVLEFWLGPNHKEHGEPTRERKRMWFSRDEGVDAIARTYIPQIRAAGRGELSGAWSSADGLTAQLILMDQLSRNAFRGTPEAFAYDERARAVALRLIEAAGDAPDSVPASAAMFVVTCLMHSESVEAHVAAAHFAKAHVAISGSPVLRRQLEVDLPDHSAVLHRFGRYPHRNDLLGRQSSAEEKAWLASDECPGWARSQGRGARSSDDQSATGRCKSPSG